MKTYQQFNEIQYMRNLKDDPSDPDVLGAFEKALPKAEAEIKKMFPSDWTVRFRIGQILGKVVDLSIYSPWKVTVHNANLGVSAMVHKADQESSVYKMERVNMNRELKYRVIKAKSPEELVKKTVAWVKKNKDKMMEISKTSRY